MFEFLLIVNIALAGLALVRLRPATFALATNHLITLRAFMSIERFGQPASEASVPASIFSSGNVSTAATLFAISTALLFLFSILAPSNRSPGKPADLPALPSWILLGVVLILMLTMLTPGTIFDQAYDDRARVFFGVNLGGASVLLDALLLYELYRRVASGRMRPIVGFGIMTLQLLLTDYLKGATGLATGFAFCSAILLLGLEGRPWRRLAWLTTTIAVMGSLSLVVRTVRSDLYLGGSTALNRVLNATSTAEESRSETGEGAELMGNGTQYAAHTLEGIALYDHGLSRDWHSIYDPLLYTLEPSFLVEPLGLARPVGAASELQDRFVSGGGMYLLGDLYWNGGLACVFIVFFAVALFAYLCDTRYRFSALWLMLCCQFAPNLLMGFGYGFAQVARGAINGLLVLGAYWLWSQWRGSGRRRPIPAPERVGPMRSGIWSRR